MAFEFADSLILSTNFGNAHPKVVVTNSSEESQTTELITANALDADELFERFDDGLTLDELL